ncbi:MAG: hypothetical protein Q8L20_04420 [Gammaproteobacteria bacterium]|nr:hypothetical protein [Gammaproteobacteria bacterium]
MKDSTRYAKIVEWSDEDQCYIGRIPGLVLGGCHGPDEQKVFEELCVIADEVVAIFHEDGDPLPPPTINGNLHKMLVDWDGKIEEMRLKLYPEDAVEARRKAV